MTIAGVAGFRTGRRPAANGELVSRAELRLSLGQGLVTQSDRGRRTALGEAP
jgi:hypothetical protein